MLRDAMIILRGRWRVRRRLAAAVWIPASARRSVAGRVTHAAAGHASHTTAGHVSHAAGHAPHATGGHASHTAARYTTGTASRAHAAGGPATHSADEQDSVAEAGSISRPSVILWRCEA